MKNFSTILKDMTVSSVHTPTAIGNEKPKKKAKPFNAIISDLDTEVKKRAPVLNVKVAKVDETLGIVLGWAIVSKINGEDYYDLNVDHDGPHAGKRVPEHVPENVMAKAGLEFVDSGAIGNEMHEGPDVGRYPFVFPMTTDAFAKLFGTEEVPPKTGLLVGYQPPAAVLTKFKDGTYSGFSIEGRRISFEEHQ